MIRLALAAALAIGLLAAGCGVTKTSYSCQNADCRVTLSGSGADTEIRSQGITLELKGVDGGKATLNVIGEDGGPDETVNVGAGDTVEVLDLTLTVESIDGGEVKVHTRPS